jgi:hypothetical protein
VTVERNAVEGHSALQIEECSLSCVVDAAPWRGEEHDVGLEGRDEVKVRAEEKRDAVLDAINLQKNVKSISDKDVADTDDILGAMGR